MKSGISILLVEDEDDDTQLAREAFKNGRILNKLDVVASGEEAMQYLRGTGKYANIRGHKPDLMLLDLRMGAMDGFDVLEEMRKDPDLADIPVIALTGLDGSKDIKRAYECGARCYVTKPIDSLEVFKAVMSLKEFGFEIVRICESTGD